MVEDALSTTERVTLFADLRDRFGIDFLKARWPWEAAAETSVLRDPRAWASIPDFVGDRNCLMFTDERESLWRFRNGADLFRVLSEAPLFEFYVCDRQLTFLLCHNHHDCLIGWGAGKSWIDDLADG